jgi:hypothetical protein
MLSEALLAGPTVINGTTSAMSKVRRDDPAPSAVTQVSLEAAQNEFESFQIVLPGPASGVTAKATSLTGPGIIPSAGCDAAGNGTGSNIRIYKESFIQIGTAVSIDDVTGLSGHASNTGDVFVGAISVGAPAIVTV